MIRSCPSAVAGNPMSTSVTIDPPKPYRKKLATNAKYFDDAVVVVVVVQKALRYDACATMQCGMTTKYGYDVRVYTMVVKRGIHVN